MPSDLPRRACASAPDGVGNTLPPGFDPDRVEAAIRELLIGIGEDPDREGLRQTPARVARACAEVFSGLGQDRDSVDHHLLPTDELVLVRTLGAQPLQYHRCLFTESRTWAITARGRPRHRLSKDRGWSSSRSSSALQGG